ncbi:hypothetical protein L9F63_021289, partial [Diploptera punctata]
SCLLNNIACSNEAGRSAGETRRSARGWSRTNSTMQLEGAERKNVSANMNTRA